MPKYKNNPLVSIITSYKARHFPYTERADYRHYLAGLMSELSTRKPDYVMWDDDLKFESYAYVYLNPLKRGKFKYVCPSGKVVYFKHEPFYVGKGIKKRMYHHLKDAENTENTTMKCHTIRKIWAAGKDPKIIPISSRVSDHMAGAFEIDMIAGIGRKDKDLGPLSNLTDGGEGASGAIRSEETCERISKARTGIKLSEEECKRMSERKKGVPFSEAHLEAIRAATSSDEYRMKMSQVKTGIPLTKEHREAIGKGQLGNKRSAETNENNRVAHIGIKHTKKTKKKMSASHKGVPWSEARIAAGNKKRRKAVSINGVIYESAHTAAEAIGISYSAMYQRVISKISFPDYKYA